VRALRAAINETIAAATGAPVVAVRGQYCLALWDLLVLRARCREMIVVLVGLAPFGLAGTWQSPDPSAPWVPPFDHTTLHRGLLLPRPENCFWFWMEQLDTFLRTVVCVSSWNGGGDGVMVWWWWSHCASAVSQQTQQTQTVALAFGDSVSMAQVTHQEWSGRGYLGCAATCGCIYQKVDAISAVRHSS